MYLSPPGRAARTVRFGGDGRLRFDTWAPALTGVLADDGFGRETDDDNAPPPDGATAAVGLAANDGGGAAVSAAPPPPGGGADAATAAAASAAPQPSAASRDSDQPDIRWRFATLLDEFVRGACAAEAAHPAGRRDWRGRPLTYSSQSLRITVEGHAAPLYCEQCMKSNWGCARACCVLLCMLLWAELWARRPSLFQLSLFWDSFTRPP